MKSARTVMTVLAGCLVTAKTDNWDTLSFLMNCYVSQLFLQILLTLIVILIGKYFGLKGVEIFLFVILGLFGLFLFYWIIKLVLFFFKRKHRHDN